MLPKRETEIVWVNWCKMLLSSSDLTDGDKGKVCGVVEGIVPTTHPSDDLKGLGCLRGFQDYHQIHS